MAKKAILKFEPMQLGDVHKTWADVNKLMDTTGYKANTKITKGVINYVDWHVEYKTK